MAEQSREILPVAVSDIVRRIQNEEEIVAGILQSLENPDNLLESNRTELETEKENVQRFIGTLSLELIMRQERAA